MLSVDLYREILPDWTCLATLNQDEVEAGVDLLLAVAFLGGLRPGDDDFAVLKMSWLSLFCGLESQQHSCEKAESGRRNTPTAPLAAQILSAHLEQSAGRIAPLFSNLLISHPRALDVLVAASTSRVRRTPSQFHLLSLLIVTSFELRSAAENSTRPESSRRADQTRQTALLRRVGQRFGLNEAAMDDLFKRLGRAYEQAVGAAPGEHSMPDKNQTDIALRPGIPQEPAIYQYPASMPPPPPTHFELPRR